MAETFAWVLEAKVKDGKRDDLLDVLEDVVEDTKWAAGILNFQYYLADDGDVLVHARLLNASSAHQLLDAWQACLARWLEAVEPTRVVHLGEVPDDVRARQQTPQTVWLRESGGFAKMPF
ncbi:MAG: hypothetical protein AAF750_10505 [Planctomycetota bacterium]